MKVRNEGSSLHPNNHLLNPPLSTLLRHPSTKIVLLFVRWLSFETVPQPFPACADEGVTPPNIFKIARKLVKSQPCRERNGYSIYNYLFYQQ